MFDTRESIYDEISKVLTDYEEGQATEKDLYNTLVRVQGEWENIITARD